VELCKKKEENCIAPYCQERELGDAYTYIAFKRRTQFFICFVVGKWNDLTCNLFYELLARRLRFPTIKRRLTIFSDGNKQNFTALANNFPQGAVNHAIRKKIRINQKIVGVVSKVVSGYVNKAEIGITEIDGFCSKLRERISCFTRKARSFAKRKLCIVQRLEIFSIQHNFIEMKNGKTPAMREGLQSKPLTWETFFYIRLTTLN
jgi:IS1 family transposase